MKITSVFLSAAIAIAANAAELPTDFSNGIIMLNEGWYGHDAGSMNFIDTDGQVYYNVYKGVNESKCLGNTLSFGQVFGDCIFVMCKQSYDSDERTGGRFIAVDANTLQFKGELTTLPGGDGRSVCAVSQHKGYIGTASGLYAIDLDTYTVADKQLAPANSSGKIQQTGEMLRVGNYLFACQQNIGVLAVDIATDEVHVIDMPKVVSLTITADGSLYAATSDAASEFVKIDPITFATETIDIEGSHAMGSTWSTWKKGSLAADATRNIVYYVVGASWTPKTISSYNFDTKEFKTEFFTLPGKSTGLSNDRILYGEGVSVDPATGHLVVAATEAGYGAHYSYNWIYFIDTTLGETVKEIALDEYYWFPSMMLYPDFDAPELNVEAVEMQKGGEKVINLSDAVTLRVGNPHLINYSIADADSDVFEATLSGKELIVKALSEGETTISITAEYQGRPNTVEVPVSVSPISCVAAIGDVDAEISDVYTLSGICVLRKATPEQLHSLAPGVYIVGGQKVSIK